MDEWLNYLGYVAGVFTTGSVVPQLIKTIREKDAGDVSRRMYILYFSGTILWILYGIIRQDGSIIVANSIACLLNITMLILKAKYNRKNKKQMETKAA